ncbi:hypothetical protein FCH28_12305 [Streptomyces piniterrae]|uniref:Large ribosomal subunit protein bL12 C-terminal domain-containing protein n=1 Tax=Streptomyces piniterrae TaxID=2571125 RepID=A0A4U0NNP3_9ACTN|nr:ribosomal protein L7/L12 [Streptomyces piniterrae]TJZ56036.1 hypothetical protein FCH28_12305 [Streptomyces piniterrae]
MDNFFPWIVLVLLVVSSAATGAGASQRAKMLDRRIQRLERKVDVLLTHLGAQEPADPGMAEIDELLRKGKKIEAIKLHRELTGSGLKEAKDEVERRMR